MPTRTHNFFPIHELKTLELAEPFTFTKGYKILKIRTNCKWINPYVHGTLLFDLHNDPNQENSSIDSQIEKQMIILLRAELKKNDAPVEQYERLGIPIDGEITEDHLRLTEKYAGTKDIIGNTEIIWQNKGKSMYYMLLRFIPESAQEQLIKGFEKAINQKNLKEIDDEFVIEVLGKVLPKSLELYIDMLTHLVKNKGK